MLTRYLREFIHRLSLRTNTSQRSPTSLEILEQRLRHAMIDAVHVVDDLFGTVLLGLLATVDAVVARVQLVLVLAAVRFLGTFASKLLLWVNQFLLVAHDRSLLGCC